MKKDAYRYVVDHPSLIKEAAKLDLVSAAKFGIGTAATLGFIGSNIMNKLNNDAKRKALLEDLCLNDPVIKQIPKKQVLEWYMTIYNVAPTLSADKTSVREILQGAARFGRLDIQTIKLLADTEKSVGSNQESWKTWASLIK